MSPIINSYSGVSGLKRATSGSFGDTQTTESVSTTAILGGAIGGVIGVAILAYCIIFLRIKRMASPANAEGRGLRGWINGLGTASVPRSEGTAGSDTICSGGGKGAFDVFPSPTRAGGHIPTTAELALTLSPPPSATSDVTPHSIMPTTPTTPTMAQFSHSTPPDRSRREFRAADGVQEDGARPAFHRPQGFSTDAAARVPSPETDSLPASTMPYNDDTQSGSPSRNEIAMADRRVSWLTDLTNSTVPEEKKARKQKTARSALRSYQKEASRSFLDF